MSFQKVCLGSIVLLLLAAGCVTTDEERAAVAGSHLGMEEHFHHTDLDKSGFVTQEEIAEYHHAALLEQYDLDDDNHLSEQEWQAAHPSTADRDAKFNQIDRDKDKKISKAEAIKWVSEHVTFTKSFAKYDLDGDSRLHWKELEEKAPTELRVTLLSLPIG